MIVKEKFVPQDTFYNPYLTVLSRPLGKKIDDDADKDMMQMNSYNIYL